MNHCDPLSSSSRSNTSIAAYRAFKTQQQFFYSTGATQGLESIGLLKRQNANGLEDGKLLLGISSKKQSHPSSIRVMVVTKSCHLEQCKYHCIGGSDDRRMHSLGFYIRFHALDVLCDVVAYALTIKALNSQCQASNVKQVSKLKERPRNIACNSLFHGFGELCCVDRKGVAMRIFLPLRKAHGVHVFLGKIRTKLKHSN